MEEEEVEVSAALAQDSEARIALERTLLKPCTGLARSQMYNHKEGIAGTCCCQVRVRTVEQTRSRRSHLRREPFALTTLCYAASEALRHRVGERSTNALLSTGCRSTLVHSHHAGALHSSSLELYKI